MIRALQTLLKFCSAKYGYLPLAGVIADIVVIDADNTDRPLFEVFIEAGIPREQIVRLNAGQPYDDELESDK